MKEDILYLLIPGVIVFALVIFIIIQNIKDCKDYIQSLNARDDIDSMIYDSK
jgi:hypothetical protein